jgi:hypothetical protein
LDYDLKTLNITGELQKYSHKNVLKHIKMVVTYQDKTTSKVNYLELDFLNSTFLNNTKNEENKNTVGVDGSSKCSGVCAAWSFCINCSTSTGVVNTATEVAGPSSLKSSKYLAQGASSILKFSSATNGIVEF